MIPPNYDEDDDEEEAATPQSGDERNGIVSAGAGRAHNGSCKPTRPPQAGPPGVGGTGGHLLRSDVCLPLVLGPKLRVLRLGEIVWLSRWFHDEKYIYPQGYAAERLMASGASGGRVVHHLMEVLAADDGVRPVFRCGYALPGVTATSPPVSSRPSCESTRICLQYIPRSSRVTASSCN